jgi:hypothetical protein
LPKNFFSAAKDAALVLTRQDRQATKAIKKFQRKIFAVDILSPKAESKLANMIL